MKTEVNPKDTDRAEAFEMWMTSPMPMVTLTKTFEVSNLLKVCRKSGMKFNALLCWCIGKIVNQYTDKFCNPMVMWGKYRKGWFKTTLPISFQFHHVQMDGGHGAMFLELLQREINNC
mgnify:CR=1 FL=1